MNEFYRFDVKYSKKAMKVMPRHDFPKLELISLNTDLIVYNDFYIAEGQNKYDIMQFYTGINYVISEKVKNLFEQHKISGWKCFPVNIEGIKEQYYCLQILSCAGPILNLERLNNLEDSRVRFDITTWDGSDFFTLEKTLHTDCTQRVKKLLEENKIKNLDFSPL